MADTPLPQVTTTSAGGRSGIEAGAAQEAPDGGRRRHEAGGPVDQLGVGQAERAGDVAGSGRALLAEVEVARPGVDHGRPARPRVLEVGERRAGAAAGGAG